MRGRRTHPAFKAPSRGPFAARRMAIFAAPVGRGGGETRPDRLRGQFIRRQLRKPGGAEPRSSIKAAGKSATATALNMDLRSCARVDHRSRGLPRARSFALERARDSVERDPGKKHRGFTIRQFQRRQTERVFRRWYSGRHPDCISEGRRPQGYQPQFSHALPRHEPRPAANRT